MPTSGAGSRPAPPERASGRGFTLLELIVVLSIMAIVSALAAPALASRFLDPPGSRSARLVKGLFEQARVSAAPAGQPVAVVWLPVSRRFVLTRAAGGGPPTASPARERETLGVEIPGEVEVVTRGFAAVEGGRWEGERPEGILFFPLGGSTGGSVLLRGPGASRSVVVDPLTGDATYEEIP